jgi:predicted MFS family arabinose efflux permease
MSAAATPLEPGGHPTVVWAFLVGNLVIGTGVMLVPGMLNVMAADLGVSIPKAGTLIGFAAVVMCLGAPVFAMLTSKWDRRKLLAGSLVLYGVLHLLCALAPNFAVLLPLRMASVVSAAIFTPQAAATLGQILAPNKRAGAITFVFVGWSLASVAALPLAAWLGAHVGWRWTFAGFGALSLVGAWWVAGATPRGVKGVPLALSAWGEVMRHPVLLAVLLTTGLSASGQFTTWGYLAPFAKALLNPSPELYSGLLVLLGGSGLVGNMLASRNASRAGKAYGGADWNVVLAIGSMAMGLALVALLGTQLWGFVLGGLVWGVGIFASNSSQQARLQFASPALAGASIALNTSMIYLGQAFGSFVGGAVIASAGYAWLPWVSVVLLCAALGVSIKASRVIA